MIFITNVRNAEKNNLKKHIPYAHKDNYQVFLNDLFKNGLRNKDTETKDIYKCEYCGKFYSAANKLKIKKHS